MQPKRKLRKVSRKRSTDLKNKFRNGGYGRVFQQLFKLETQMLSETETDRTPFQLTYETTTTLQDLVKRF